MRHIGLAATFLLGLVSILIAGCSTGANGIAGDADATTQPHVAPGLARSVEGPASPGPSPIQPADTATATPLVQTPAPTSAATSTTAPTLPPATATPSPAPTTAPPTVPTPPVQVQLSVETADGTHSVPISVELATTSAERSVGLSNRHYLAPDDGMLFIFPSMTSSPFWMKDTFIPLDIAYLGADGTVQEIHLGEPKSEDLIYPSQPYRYTLEMNGGWFAANGFSVGDRVVLP